MPHRMRGCITYVLILSILKLAVSCMMWLSIRDASDQPSALPLPVQPQRGGATAVIEREVGGIMLHIGLPGARDHARSEVHIVLLFCSVALKLPDELLARLQVLGPPLLLEHGRELGVVDMAAIARLLWEIHAIGRAIGFPGDGDRTHGHALIFARERRRQIGAILLEF